MTPPETEADLQRLIDDGVEESLHLEYKGAGAVAKQQKDEIRKDVSSFANADGGVIFYGIREYSAQDKKHLPERIDPIDRTQFSREWLDQVIGEIQPRIEGLEIVPISVSGSSTLGCYVVVVPPGTTAHQSSDGRYYRRRNFEATWMEDYEIREVMNRTVHPVIEAKVKLELYYHVISGLSSTIELQLSNVSRKIATHYCAEIYIPGTLPNGTPFVVDVPYEIREIDGFEYWCYAHDNASQSPLFPGMTRFYSKAIDLGKSLPGAGKCGDEIEIQLYADNASPITLRKSLKLAEMNWT